VKKTKPGKSKKNKKKKTAAGNRSGLTPVTITGIRIHKRWDLPENLTEISGISYVENNRLACVQDESGTVFIYNLESGKIEKEIHFSGKGDFEGIAVTGKTIYIIRADGILFSINDFSTNPVIEQINTGLTLKNDIESLCYDDKNNRLLLTGKNEDPGKKYKKLIFAFNIEKGKMKKKPVIVIDLKNPVFKSKALKKGGVLEPSDMSMHPKTDDIYITDGPAAKLFVIDHSGSIKAFHELNEKEIPQAEGISFSPDGDVFISTEGKKKPAAILQIELINP